MKPHAFDWIVTGTAAAAAIFSALEGYAFPAMLFGVAFGVTLTLAVALRLSGWPRA